MKLPTSTQTAVLAIASYLNPQLAAQATTPSVKPPIQDAQKEDSSKGKSLTEKMALAAFEKQIRKEVSDVGKVYFATPENQPRLLAIADQVHKKISESSLINGTTNNPVPMFIVFESKNTDAGDWNPGWGAGLGGPYICFSTATIENLSDAELNKVVSHEFGHLFSKENKEYEPFNYKKTQNYLVPLLKSGKITFEQFMNYEHEFTADAFAVHINCDPKGIGTFIKTMNDVDKKGFLQTQLEKRKHREDYLNASPEQQKQILKEYEGILNDVLDRPRTKLSPTHPPDAVREQMSVPTQPLPGCPVTPAAKKIGMKK
jgi:hypothetical protein